MKERATPYRLGPFWGAPGAVSLPEEAAIDWEVNADEIADTLSVLTKEKREKGGRIRMGVEGVRGWLAIHE